RRLAGLRLVVGGGAPGVCGSGGTTGRALARIRGRDGDRSGAGGGTVGVRAGGLGGRLGARRGCCGSGRGHQSRALDGGRGLGGGCDGGEQLAGDGRLGGRLGDRRKVGRHFLRKRVRLERGGRPVEHRQSTLRRGSG